MPWPEQDDTIGQHMVDALRDIRVGSCRHPSVHIAHICISAIAWGGGSSQHYGESSDLFGVVTGGDDSSAAPEKAEITAHLCAGLSDSLTNHQLADVIPQPPPLPS